jgi:NADH dehydrogenase FAD-containing subunit
LRTWKVPSARKGSNLHRIVVVGGCAVALELTIRLGDKYKQIEITLIDKLAYAIVMSLLQEVAAEHPRWFRAG